MELLVLDLLHFGFLSGVGFKVIGVIKIIIQYSSSLYLLWTCYRFLALNKEGIDTLKV